MTRTNFISQVADPEAMVKLDDPRKRFPKWSPPTFDETGLTRWNWMCQYTENLVLGRYVDIGAFTYINAKYGVVMEDLVQVGSHCSIYSLSTIDNKKGKVVLRKNARIGSHTVIMPGVTVGENSVVGALSYVREDIPANSVAYGIPAHSARKSVRQSL
jgi:acetyltransferase-like isoleucine patch superfamily enzyme